MEDIGKITKISGAVVYAKGLKNLSKNLLLRIGEDSILGEVIQIQENESIIQAYEETTGIQLGQKVVSTGGAYNALLGPKLLGQVFDGLQRPLNSESLRSMTFLARGTSVEPIDNTLEIEFFPTKTNGERIDPGQEIGYCMENTIRHPILLPHHFQSMVIDSIVEQGRYKLHATLAKFEDGNELTALHRWEVRKPRPFRARFDKDSIFLTGQRILDSFFPIPLGGTAAISGGFGTGKTILEQTIAKNAITDIVVLVLIGERGNEVATVLDEFSHLTDENGKPLMDRTVVIVNTSNMPVAAREASIYLGLTIAEYYRDLGLNVCLLADSISRWAEASREISSRLEEMPGEEGYPSYMSKQLGEFIERAGYFRTHNNSEGSITFIAAVSPPGGDYTEPVTQAALQISGGFWALNTELARSRHFPAIDWRISYSLYSETLCKKINEEWPNWIVMRKKLLEIMEKEDELDRNVRLLGKESLSESQKGYLRMAHLIKNAFLQQNAFDRVDMFCSLKKQHYMMKVLTLVWELFEASVKHGITSEQFFNQEDINKHYRLSETSESDEQYFKDEIGYLENKIRIMGDSTHFLQ